jgi:hypothetical protein
VKSIAIAIVKLKVVQLLRSQLQIQADYFELKILATRLKVFKTYFKQFVII